MSETTTRDAFLGGQLLLEQPRRGHRVGTDAALLAAAVDRLPEGAHVVDLGAGVGAVGLAIARRRPDISVLLVEIEPAIAALARQNIVANGLSGRVALIEADVTLAGASRVAAGLVDDSADLVVMNPPFHVEGTVRAAQAAYRRNAHAMEQGEDEAWLRTAAALLRPAGILIVIHRADALPRLLVAAGNRFGDIRILPVLPQAGAPAIRLLMRTIKGSRAPLTLLAPLVLHDGGAFTPLAGALHRGEASLDWHTPGR